MKGISVIIPVYNREAFLGEAIGSVLAQDFAGPLEIVVSDDGSTDGSVAVARSFGTRVRVVLKPEGCSTQGVAGTRNRGIAAATQPYVAFLDSDDFFLPNHLSRLAAVLERRTDLGFAFSRMLQMIERNGSRWFAPWTRAHITKRDIRNPVVSGPYIVSTNVLLFRRAVFTTVGVFNESYSHGEDGDLWLRISERYEGALAEHYGAVYRIAHGAGQLTNEQRLRQCALRLWPDALARYNRLNMNNRFHLFRLRFIVAAIRKGDGSRLRYGMALVALLLRHPVFMIEHVGATVGRSAKRRRRPEWKEIAASIDIASCFGPAT